MNLATTPQEVTFLGQTAPLLWVIVVAIAAFIAIVLRALIKFLTSYLMKLSQRTHGKVDDIVFACVASTKGWALFFWVLNPLAHLIGRNPDVDRLLGPVTIIVTALQALIWGSCAIHGWQKDFVAPRIVRDASSASAMNLLVTSVKALFMIAVVLICLSNLGVDIGALVAGLGVGGIAVALAAQNILGDLFASLSIVLDKPFVIGDYIVVGNDQGTVENIGIKTTRVRSLSGEELIFSNKDLLESRIKNFKRMWERRVVLSFGVPYETPREKLAIIPQWVQGFIGEETLLRFERSHLSGLGKGSLDFETVYWVTDADFNKYMDLQQRLFMKILEKFAAENIEFALPIQVIQVETKEKTLLPTATDSSRPLRNNESSAV